ncbi:MAG: DUF389 domain-containing protein [Haliscomenobacter sp.]|nr:DUF389 domain-containing protein [Haliscomenobacter sp.]
MRARRRIVQLLHYFNLEAEINDFEEIHDAILRDMAFKGTNLWILLFAAIIASVGLNVNSTAVIIGAMLISPLMGPINGMGYSIATYNYPLFRKSLQHFLFAVITALGASTAYFAMSPLSGAHSELLARTSPTIYDVLIALFGGLAGILAISSKLKGNVIPGVAIATALMPPLCTAGYGLATAQFNFFFGAFYLFTINAVFIALSSVLISYILNFPIRTVIEEGQKKRVNQLVAVIIVLILIPSVYFGYRMVQQEHFSEQANRYVRSVNIVEGNYLLKSEINAGAKTIHLIYGGMALDDIQKTEIIHRARDFELKEATIIIEKGLSFEAPNTRNTEVETLKGELNRLNLVLQTKDAQMDSVLERTTIGQELLAEIKPIYPQISTCAYVEGLAYTDSLSTPSTLGLAYISCNEKSLSQDEKNKISSWLKIKMNIQSLNVYYEEGGNSPPNRSKNPK